MSESPSSGHVFRKLQPKSSSSSSSPASTSTSEVIHYPFWFGGSASCLAACVTHPLDLVKVRLQTASTTVPTSSSSPNNKMLGTFIHVLRSDGFLGLYSGLSASLLRQITYSTTRFGVYEHLKDRFTPSSTSQTPSFLTLLSIASASGFLGGLAGNPADVLNVRMQHDRSLPPSQRRNYSHAIDGLIRIAKEESWRGLFRGVWPNSLRAMLMTSSQLASYDTFKSFLLTHSSSSSSFSSSFPASSYMQQYTNLKFEDNLTTHFTASFLAGFVATTICSPVDVIKTRLMSARHAPGEESLSLWRVLKDVYRLEGWTWVFKGWLPSFIRLAPHTIVTFLFLEQHKRLWRRWRDQDHRED